MAETPALADVLRKPFPPELLGKLPRVTCPKCSDRRTECTEHRKGRCKVCDAWISEKHIHLDYVGHADVTARLLDADPEWSWQPEARDIDPHVVSAAAAAGPEVLRMVLENAPPKFDLDDRGGPVGLWIRLTVGGTTRPGYGSCPSGQNDAVKVLIGDALRNAAMRFGDALDLWAKGDRADPTAENATASGGQASRNGGPRPAARPAPRPAAGHPEVDEYGAATLAEQERMRTGPVPGTERLDGTPPGDPWHAVDENGEPRQPGKLPRPVGPQPPKPRGNRAPAPPPGEIDEAAQQFADKAADCRTIEDLDAVKAEANDARKMAAPVRSPEGGKTVALGVWLNTCRKYISEAAEAVTS